MRLIKFLALSCALYACTDVAPNTQQRGTSGRLPAAKSFAAAPAPTTQFSNAILARDFERLVFSLESGRDLPVFSRFEGPISVALIGPSTKPTTSRDLDLVLARLRNEAGINIARRNDPNANIVIELVPNRAFRRAVPNAACFVVPNVSSWADFRRLRGTSTLDWTQLTRREQMAIFIPAEVSAQETRDCLHEELAQALGPVNDLYDLTDSVFNDDNFQTILTGFDMAILRAVYAPELTSGMSRDRVMAQLPAILARQRPGFQFGGAVPAPRTSQEWKNSIVNALGASADPGGRQSSARKAVLMARQQGWRDNRLGFALYALARLSIASDPAAAQEAFREADEIFRSDPDTRIHAAHISAQLAALALSSGRIDQAIAITEENAPVALAAQNAGLLSALLMIKSVGLSAQGRDQEAQIVELDSLAWARYAYSSEGEIKARADEIRRLVRRQPTGVN